MSAFELASLFASVKLEDKMTNPLSDAVNPSPVKADNTSGLSSHMSGVGGLIASIGVAAFFSEAIRSAREASAANRQLDAVLESTRLSEADNEHIT